MPRKASDVLFLIYLYLILIPAACDLEEVCQKLSIESQSVGSEDSFQSELTHQTVSVVSTKGEASFSDKGDGKAKAYDDTPETRKFLEKEITLSISFRDSLVKVTPSFLACYIDEDADEGHPGQIVVQFEKVYDFADKDFLHKFSRLNFSKRLKLYYGTAKGLGHIHAEGIVHCGLNLESICLNDIRALQFLFRNFKSSIYVENKPRAFCPAVPATIQPPDLKSEECTASELAKKADVYSLALLFMHVENIINAKRNLYPAFMKSMEGERCTQGSWGDACLELVGNYISATIANIADIDFHDTKSAGRFQRIIYDSVKGCTERYSARALAEEIGKVAFFRHKPRIFLEEPAELVVIESKAKSKWVDCCGLSSRAKIQKAPQAEYLLI